MCTCVSMCEIGGRRSQSTQPTQGSQGLWFPGETDGYQAIGSQGDHTLGLRLGQTSGSDFIFGGSKITADGDCSHEIRRRLLLGRKVMTNLDSVLKSTVQLVQEQ